MQSLYNDLPALCVALTSSGKILSVNRLGAQLLGIPHYDAIGQSILILLEQRDRIGFSKHLEACIQHPVRISDVYCTFISRSGRPIPIIGKVRQAPDLGTGVILLVGILVKHRTGDSAGLLDRYLQQALDSSTDWACIYDVNRECILFVGQVLAATLGRDPQDLQGQEWQTLIHPQDLAPLQKHLQTCVENAPSTPDLLEIEFRVKDRQGEWRWWNSQNRGFVSPTGTLPERRLEGVVLGTVRDVTQRKQAELLLQRRIKQEQLLLEITEEIYQSLDLDRILATTVEEVRKLLKLDRVAIYRCGEGTSTFVVESRTDTALSSGGESETDLLDLSFFQQFRQGEICVTDDVLRSNYPDSYKTLMRQIQVQSEAVVPIEQGNRLWGLLFAQHCEILWRWQPWEIELLRHLSTKVAIAINQADLYRQTELQAQREQALNRMMRVLRTSLNLKTVFSTAVKLMTTEFHLSGASIWQYHPESQVWRVISARSISDSPLSLLEMEISDREPGGGPLEELKGQRALHMSADEVLARGVDPAIADYLPGRWLVMALQVDDKKWGCLILSDRQSSPVLDESGCLGMAIALVEQLEVAIQQAELYRQVQTLNYNLERQIRSRTHQLQQALELEETLKHITDKVRDSLEEEQILQTAVKELALGLGVDCCESALYSNNHSEFTIAYDYTIQMVSAKGYQEQIDPHNRIHQALLSGQYIQFCPLDLQDVTRRDVSRLELGDSSAILVCPIVDEREVLGNIWLFRPRACTFGDLEVRIVKQVATQCAIAIRQARLYQAAQLQVEKLEQLNQLKDDFLNTVSHELRTPITSMRMAIQMLGVSLEQPLGLAAELAKPTAERSRTARYYQILKQECDREIRLVDDLLSLQRLESPRDEWDFDYIHLPSVLSQIVEPFKARTATRQQVLRTHIPNDLPTIATDLAAFERIVSELLLNAHKFTPEGHTIELKVLGTAERIELSVLNTGVEIPPTAIDRIFDKFYRVPSSDPWKQGGTGLGLALVKRLVEHLQGEIFVTSANNCTEFRVSLPRLQSNNP